MRIFTSDQFHNNQIKAVIIAGVILLSLILIEESILYTDELSCNQQKIRQSKETVNIVCDNYLSIFFVAPNLIIFFIARSKILNHLEKKRNKTWRSYR